METIKIRSRFRLFLLAAIVFASSCDQPTKDQSKTETTLDVPQGKLKSDVLQELLNEAKKTPQGKLKSDPLQELLNEAKKTPQGIPLRNLEQVRRDFLYIMDWYHETVEFDRSMVQIIETGEDSYSVKITVTWSQLNRPFQPEGICIWCQGSGKGPGGGFADAHKPKACIHCDGSGRNELEHRQEVKIGTMNYVPNTNQVSLDINLRKSIW